MIEFKKITKVFRSEELETTALNEINFEIKEKEFVAIMGPSGCGKSTMLNILGLLDTPSDGEYYFDGDLISNYSESQRAKLRKENMGFVFQNFNLIDELSVFDNVELPLVYLKVSKEERKRRTEAILEKMNIGHRKNHFPSQLSGGQQQRVAIARAVVTEPKLILADEPTGNLDSTNGKDVMDLLGKLNDSGATIIMVTHSLEDVKYAGRVLNLFDGKIKVS